MKVKCRRFEGENDYFLLRDFLEKNISETGSRFYFTLNDLEFYTDISEDKTFIESMVQDLENVFFWFEDDELIGGIFLFERPLMFMNPRKKNLFNDMFKTVEEEVKEFIKEGKGTEYVSDFRKCEWRPYEGETEIEKVLIENGYAKSDDYWVQRDFKHNTPVEERALPEGFYFKPFAEITEPEAVSKVIEIYKECLGMGFDESGLRNAEKYDTYRKELDIIVMSPENIPVALSHGRYDEKNKMATFVAVACHFDYRKRGISKAVMLKSLKGAEELGAEVSTVFTRTPDMYPAPNKLYEGVGFELVGNRRTWKYSE